jgi:glycosyltransferase involved in cell wall biosynthesis
MKQVVLPDAGMCAHDESPKQMAKLILDIINNPELIEKMSRAAMKNRKDVFQSTQIKNLLGVYEKALKKSK